MSLTDRHRAAAAAPPAPPQAPPDAPARVADPAPKPYKLLFVIAAVLAVAAVIGFIAIFASRGPAAGTPPATTAPTTVASASPTLDARQQAATDAQKAYETFWRALEDIGETGDLAAEVKRAKALSSGSAHQLIDSSAKNARDLKIRQEGNAAVTSRVDSLSDLSEKRPIAQLATCVDQRSITQTKDGQPFPPPPIIQGTATLERINGRWIVTDVASPPLEQQPEQCSL